MKYDNVKKAVFVNRINRFCSNIEIDGKTQLCHVKNTGRLCELLVKGAVCFVQEHDNPDRKTKYSLVAVQKGQETVNIDSTAPNKVFYEWVRDGHFCDGVTLIKPEKTYGNSRFDCYIEAGDRKMYVEVKGVTLEKNGTALFPDAPTQRGVKHLRELCRCVNNGFDAYIVFVIQMKGINEFSPNTETHKEFANALCECRDRGVNILALDCDVTPDTLNISQKIQVKL